MNGIRLQVTDLRRDFNRRPVFQGISFTLDSPASLAVTGLNGAGKSTLVKVLAGVIGPTAGTVAYQRAGVPIEIDTLRHELGFVSPYLNLYDEFSAEENLRLLSRIRSGNEPASATIERRMQQVNLWNRRHDDVGTFSSGMKQRLKYAFALLHEPAVLMLDEPTSNLDAEGIAVVEAIVAEQKERGLLVVATNDESEAAWCTARVHLSGSGGNKR